MPTLDWIGKKAVINHHNEVPFHLLRCNPELSVGEDSGNLLVQGDNLLALKALLPYYAGQVKCIYIDPPYNTGNEGWVYNDNVNSPEMREWLGKVVGGEAEDLSRHDKWLCMMYPRLVLLREMLRVDGSLWMSIDDKEVQNACCILDEIFGAKNFISTIIWQKIDGPKNSAIHLSEDHEYILVYAKNAHIWRPNKLPRTDEMISRYKNPDNDSRGPWLLSDLAARNFYAQGRYSITTPTGRIIEGPPAGSYWRVSKDKFEELNRDNRIWWGKNKNNRPGIKRFLSEVQDGIVPQTLWLWKDVGSTRHSKQELSKIMNQGASHDLFITPKPTQLIRRIVSIASNPGDIILDSFAGSGTTGHSILQINNKENPPRQFILVEMDLEISINVTHTRLTRAIKGYEWSGQKESIHSEDGLDGGFRFCELGPTLFDAHGQIRPDVPFADLARHVFFTETGQPMPQPDETALLGVHQSTAVYLLYNGVMRDAGNVLTPETLAALPPFDGPRVIYADGCKMGRERLREMNITFKQTPYEIRVR